VAAQEVADAAVVFVGAAGDVDLAAADGRGKRLGPCVLARVLLPLVHLLLEGARLLLVDKRQAGHALLELEGMEEGAVLVVLERVVDLLVPDHPSIRRGDVDQLDPKGVADQVVGQHGGALQARVGPSSPVLRVHDVQAGDGDGLDLVRGLGHGPLDRLLVGVGENGGHVVEVKGQGLQSSFFRRLRRSAVRRAGSLFLWTRMCGPWAS
jgi:hypothetical protein